MNEVIHHEDACCPINTAAVHPAAVAASGLLHRWQSPPSQRSCYTAKADTRALKGVMKTAQQNCQHATARTGIHTHTHIPLPAESPPVTPKNFKTLRPLQLSKISLWNIKPVSFISFLFLNAPSHWNMHKRALQKDMLRCIEYVQDRV